MTIRSQASQQCVEGSETRASARRRQVASKRPAPLWGDDIVRSVRKRAAVWQLIEGKYEVLPNGCWRWTEKFHSSGYPNMWIPTVFGNISVPVHRLTWILTHGPIPMEPSGKRSMSVCHKCDYPPCINPEHHFLGTQSDNMKDMARKGRSCLGIKNSQAKVSDEVVEEIRRLAKGGEKQYVLCEKFNLSPAQISRIIRGRRRQTAGGDTIKRHGNYRHGKYAKRRDGNDIA